jgi:hypothetical protein
MHFTNKNYARRATCFYLQALFENVLFLSADKLANGYYSWPYSGFMSICSVFSKKGMKL